LDFELDLTFGFNKKTVDFFILPLFLKKFNPVRSLVIKILSTFYQSHYLFYL